MDVSVIIVNWNTRELLRACLASVYAATRHLRFEVIVVDNHSHDGSAAMVRAEFPQVRLIENADNLGFGRANNQAMRVARGRYYLLLNSDAELREGCAERLAAHLDEHPDVAVVGPRLDNPDGSWQLSACRFPTLGTEIAAWFALRRLFPRSPSIGAQFYGYREGTFDADWLVGACLLVRREAAARVGLFDEAFFMYAEEMDWCRRFAQAGWRVVYHDAARCMHHGGQSSLLAPQAMLVEFFRSRYQYHAKHGDKRQGLHRVVHASALYLRALAAEAASLAAQRHREALRRKAQSYRKAWRFCLGLEQAPPPPRPQKPAATAVG